MILPILNVGEYIHSSNQLLLIKEKLKNLIKSRKLNQSKYNINIIIVCFYLIRFYL